MYIFCINAINLFNVIASMYKYTKIGTTDVTDWLLIIGQFPILFCNIMFIWFEPVSMTPLTCHLWLSKSHSSMQAVYYSKLLFNYYTIMIFKLMTF